MPANPNPDLPEKKAAAAAAPEPGPGPENPETLSQEQLQQALRQAPASALSQELWRRQPDSFLGHDQHALHISLAALAAELERRSRWFSEQARLKEDPSRQTAAAATAQAAVLCRQALLALSLTEQA